MLRSAVLQQPPELADQACRPGRSEPGGGAAGEVAKPGRRVIKAGSQAAGRDERPLRVFLPAPVAQARPAVAAELTAPGADAGRVFRRPGPRAAAAPAGLLAQVSGLAAARACLPGLFPLAPVMTARAPVPVPPPDRAAAVGAHPRACLAPARPGQQHAGQAAARARAPGCLRLPAVPAPAAVVAADDANRCPAPGAVPLPLHPRASCQIGGIERPPEAAFGAGAAPQAARRGAPPAWCPPRTGHQGCTAARCTRPPGWTASPAPAAR